MGRVHNFTLVCTCLVFTTLFVSLNAVKTEVGIENRGNLDPKQKQSGTGKFQSPIELSRGTSEILWFWNSLQRTHKPAQAVIKNQGHGIMVEWEGDAGGVVKNDTEYKLRKVYWNSPAKHILEGERFPVEVHMVHSNSIGQTIVVAISYALGTPDPFLAEVLDKIQSVKVDDIHSHIIDPRKIHFRESEPYFSFSSALEVPPCTEGVLWNVLQLQKTYYMSRTVSQKQIRALRSAIHEDYATNERPTQSWEGKHVYLVANTMQPPDDYS